MISVKINNRFVLVAKNISILEACSSIGIKIPRFCYHESLSVAGNCRVCLVEVNKSPKPIASCATPVSDNLEIFTGGPGVLKAQENILEVLLLNHPLDCPICDQGGECDLQDHSQKFGGLSSRNNFNRRGTEDKNCGVLVKTIMTRCIHCTRCVRFGQEISQDFNLGTLLRGNHTEIGNFIPKMLKSEVSANIVDLCPVGALTFKPFSFQSRPWELKSYESIDLTDGLCSSLYLTVKESDVVKVLPKKNKYLNKYWLTDKARFNYDSLNSNRVSNIFILNNNLKKRFFSTGLSSNNDLYYYHFFFTLKKKKSLVVVNSHVDLQSLYSLTILKYLSNQQIKTVHASKGFSYRNFQIWSNSSRVNSFLEKSKVYILAGLDLNIECSLLNLRLKDNINNNNNKPNYIVSRLNCYKHSSFLNLHSKEIFLLFFSKNRLLSKLLLNSLNITWLHNNTFLNRFDSFFLKLIKKKLPSFREILVSNQANTHGLKFADTPSFSRNDFNSSHKFFLYNVEDSIFIRKCIKSRRYLGAISVVLFAPSNFYGQKFVDIIFPSLMPVESGGLFFNLEMRPQSLVSLPRPLPEALSITGFIETLTTFGSNLKVNLFSLTKAFDVLNELAINPHLFDSFFNFPGNKVKFFNLNLESNFFLNFYSLRFILEDSLQNCLQAKYSKILQKNSYLKRLNSTNF